MITTGYMNESTKFDSRTPANKLAAQAKKLIEKAKKSNDNKDAWAVVDFLYDFPNVLCESVSEINESVDPFKGMKKVEMSDAEWLKARKTGNYVTDGFGNVYEVPN